MEIIKIAIVLTVLLIGVTLTYAQESNQVYIDYLECFGLRIFNLFLGSSVIMQFTKTGKAKVEISLAQRSLVMFCGNARNSWKHGLPIRSKDNGIARGTRLSLYFRYVNKAI